MLCLVFEHGLESQVFNLGLGSEGGFYGLNLGFDLPGIESFVLRVSSTILENGVDPAFQHRVSSV